MNEDASEAELDRRVRNGIIGYWEWISSYEEQRRYQATVPLVNVPNEAINQWQDWVLEERLNTFAEPTFSFEDQAAIRQFHREWLLVIDETPWQMPSLERLIGTKPWERLRLAAEKALEVFMRTGQTVR